MSITLDGTTGIVSPLFDGPLDAADLTGSVDSARLTSVPAANLTGDVAAARITDALNASGSAPIYACRAWVNFNGTGTVAIRASGNVSSITDNGTGDYTVNFTTAMPDANYCAVAVSTGSVLDDGGAAGSAKTTSAFRFSIFNFASARVDVANINIAIFR
jgi:hypothetical protein